MKYNRIQYLLIIALSAALYSCVDEYDETGYEMESPIDHCLYVYDCYLNFPEASSRGDMTKTVYINTEGTTTDWKLSGLPDWLKANCTSGNTSMEITLTASDNNTAYERQAVLTVTSSDMSGSSEINVSQEGAEPKATPSEGDLRIGANGTTQTISIDSNCDWKAYCYESWVTYEEKGTELIITVEPNGDNWDRSTTVYLEGGGIGRLCEINVYQEGAQIIPSEEYLWCGANGATRTITIDSNCDWNAYCDDSWVTCEKKGTELIISVESNDEYWGRSTTVYFENAGCGQHINEIRIEQEGKGY